MKPNLNHRKDQGSMFLVVFLAVVVVTVGGCAVYHVHKWATRYPINDPGYVPPRWSNDLTSITAPGTADSVTWYNGMILPNHYVIQVNDDGSPITKSAEDYIPPKTVHPVVVMRLNESNRVTLTFTNDRYWTQVDMAAAVTNNTMYAKPEGVVWAGLQRSSDMVTWKTLLTNIGIVSRTMYRDMEASIDDPRYFYRTAQW